MPHATPTLTATPQPLSIVIPGRALSEEATPRRARGRVRVDLLATREIGGLIASPYIGIPDYRARGRFIGLRFRLHNDTNRSVEPGDAFVSHVVLSDGYDVWSVWTHAEEHPNDAPNIIRAYNYNEGEAEPTVPVVPGESATMWAVFQVPTATTPTRLALRLEDMPRGQSWRLPPIDERPQAERQWRDDTVEPPPAFPTDPVVEPPAPARPVGDCPSEITQEEAWVVFDEITDGWSITICRTAAGSHLYHGEALDERAASITLEATLTRAGAYEATNGSYRYVVEPEKLTVWHGSELLLEEWFILGE